MNSGQAGEDAALAYLTRQRLIPVERNFRCRHGEINLFLRDQSTLVVRRSKKAQQCAIRWRSRQHYSC